MYEEIPKGPLRHGAALVLALLLCMKERVKYGISEDNLYDGLLWGIPIGIVGARVYYVLFYLDRFRTSDGKFDFGSAIAFWDGGLAIYGTVIAVIILAVCLSRRKGKRGFKFFAMTDLVVMGLLVGQIVGRWGNFMNREAFGSETTCLFRMQLTTKAGQLIEVHPTFLYESVWNLVGLLLLLFVVSKHRKFDGENTWFYFLWYGIGRFWVEGLRTDSLWIFKGGIPIGNLIFFPNGLRVSQVLSIIMVIAFGTVLIVRAVKRHKKQTAEDETAPLDPSLQLVSEDGAAEAESADESAPAPEAEVSASEEPESAGESAQPEEPESAEEEPAAEEDKGGEEAEENK